MTEQLGDGFLISYKSGARGNLSPAVRDEAEALGSVGLLVSVVIVLAGVLGAGAGQEHGGLGGQSAPAPGSNAVHFSLKTRKVGLFCFPELMQVCGTTSTVMCSLAV